MTTKTKQHNEIEIRNERNTVRQIILCLWMHGVCHIACIQLAIICALVCAHLAESIGRNGNQFIRRSASAAASVASLVRLLVPFLAIEPMNVARLLNTAKH